jgi:HEAT repeat protein
MNKLPSLLWLCLLGLAVCSCGRRPLGPDQIERNRLFAEILERQDRRSLGEDDFFPMHLRDTSQPRVQEWCALALGRIGHPRALPWLRESLHSALAPLRAASAFAIGEIEDRELLRSEGRDPDA